MYLLCRSLQSGCMEVIPYGLGVTEPDENRVLWFRSRSSSRDALCIVLAAISWGLGRPALSESRHH